MDARKLKEIIKQEKLIPILRTKSANAILDIAGAVINGGTKIIEYTMTTQGIIKEIERVKNKFPELIIGLGTVLEKSDAEEAIKHGADFIVSPILNMELIDTVKSKDKMVILSGFTPTELYNAYKAGSDMVKLFPASEMKPTFIQMISGPLPFLEIFPTGGLDLITAIQFLSYGAVAVGMGRTIFKRELIEKKRFDEISLILQNANHRIKNLEI